MIDVVVSDLQPLFLDGLARVIRQDSGLHLVAEAADGHAALAAIREHRPAVALLARELGELSGERVLSAVVRDRLPTRVVLFDAEPWSALGDGAAGVLSRRASPDAVRSAVRCVARGGIALCAEARASVAYEIRARRPREHPLLSPREQQVLELIADGLSAPEIARRLQLATTTIRTHIQRLYDKLEASDRAQLTRHAMRRKLLD
jgi:two-component system, NarL family, nitrate/nitrite response regulator NarL